MRIFILILFGLMLHVFTGCTEPEATIPVDLIPRDLFVQVMLDVQLAEGMKTQMASGNRVSADNAPELYMVIFEKHGVTKDGFLRTYVWYREHPELMESVYENVLDSLNKLDVYIRQDFADELKMQRDSVKSITRKKPDNTLKTLSEQ